MGYVGSVFPNTNGNAIITGPGPTLNQHYSYGSDSNAMLFEQRLAFVHYPQWQPYIITGFGLSWNTLNNYSGFNGTISFSKFLTASPITPSTPFPNNTTDSFAYEAGIGVAHPFSKLIALTTEYRYINFGKGALGALNSPKVTGFPTTTLYSNAILISLKMSFA